MPTEISFSSFHSGQLPKSRLYDRYLIYIHNEGITLLFVLREQRRQDGSFKPLLVFSPSSENEISTQDQGS